MPDLTTINPETRRVAIDWLLDLIDQEMVHDLGVVATPLDHLPPNEERAAVMAVRAAVQRLHGEEGPCIGGDYCGRTTNGWFASGSHGSGWYCGWCEAIPDGRVPEQARGEPVDNQREERP